WVPLLPSSNSTLRRFLKFLSTRISTIDLSGTLVSRRDGYCSLLFTENRRADDPNSLEATLADSWKPGCLPVLTLANKGKFEHSAAYATRVAKHVAELLFDIAMGLNYSTDRPRIYVPR